MPRRMPLSLPLIAETRKLYMSRLRRVVTMLTKLDQAELLAKAKAIEEKKTKRKKLKPLEERDLVWKESTQRWIKNPNTLDIPQYLQRIKPTDQAKT